jgi:putative nucleotidyltransferase with HDIG domain
MPDVLTKKIDVEDVEVGMYLEDVFNDRGLFLLSANTLIDSTEQIAHLKKQGVKTVYINPHKGKDIDLASRLDKQFSPLAEKRWSIEQETEYYHELPRAKEVRHQTFETAKEMLNSVRAGRAFSASKAEKCSEEIVKSIMRNGDALVSLCQIKGYDDYTFIHSVNVSVLMTSMVDTMGRKENDLYIAGLGGLLHDIGKMRVPESILNKPGKYADWEFEAMKKHPDYGLALVHDKPNIPDQARHIIGQHHERFNGTGYPRGLKGKEIDEFALIAAVADVYDALTSDRVYRAAWTPQKALALIFQGCDADYSRNIVEMFTKHLGVFPVGSFAKLFTGEMGIVTRVEKGQLLAPEVLILFDKYGKRLDEPVEYALAKKQKEPDGQQYKIELSLNPKAYRVDVAKYLGKPLDI